MVRVGPDMGPQAVSNSIWWDGAGRPQVELRLDRAWFQRLLVENEVLPGFAFNFNVRRYDLGDIDAGADAGGCGAGGAGRTVLVETHVETHFGTHVETVETHVESAWN